MKRADPNILLIVLAGLTACAEPPPPPTVEEFLADSVLLDATMVRCGANRSSTKYEADCVNAREAINRMALAEEEAKRADLEQQSERKRRALRRAQEAAASARRRAAEAERLRQEAAYLSQFDSPTEGVPAAGPAQEIEGGQPPINEAVPDSQQPELPPDTPTEAAPTGGDLDAIREELRRRQDSPQ